MSQSHPNQSCIIEIISCFPRDSFPFQYGDRHNDGRNSVWAARSKRCLRRLLENWWIIKMSYHYASSTLVLSPQLQHLQMLKKIFTCGIPLGLGVSVWGSQWVETGQFITNWLVLTFHFLTWKLTFALHDTVSDQCLIFWERSRLTNVHGSAYITDLWENRLHLMSHVLISCLFNKPWLWEGIKSSCMWLPAVTKYSTPGFTFFVARGISSHFGNLGNCCCRCFHATDQNKGWSEKFTPQQRECATLSPDQRSKLNQTMRADL